MSAKNIIFSGQIRLLNSTPNKNKPETVEKLNSKKKMELAGICLRKPVDIISKQANEWCNVLLLFTNSPPPT